MASPAVQGVGAVLLLVVSNTFMTTAWYLHIKFKSWSLAKAIFISWLIAFLEYCSQVPGNRIGHFEFGGPFTAPQLKVIQEFLSLSAFAIFSVTILKEKLRWKDLGAFVLIVAGVAVAMIGKPDSKATPPPVPAPGEAPAPTPEFSVSGSRRLMQLASAKSHSRSSSRGSGDSLPAGLPSDAPAAKEPLRAEGSAHILVAGGVSLHAGPSAAVHRRSVDVEAGSESGAAAAAAREEAGGSEAATPKSVRTAASEPSELHSQPSVQLDPAVQ